MRECPKCQSSLLIRFGHKILQRPVLQDGKRVMENARVQRFKCSQCAHICNNTPDTDHELIDAIVRSALRTSARTSADRFQCDERYVRTLVRNWLSAQSEPDWETPVNLGVFGIDIDGSRSLVAFDPQNDIVLDITKDWQELSHTLSGKGDCPLLVVCGLDPEVATGIKAFGDNQAIAIPPSVARDEIKKVSLKSLQKQIRDAASAGRNFREDERFLFVADEDLGPEDREHMSMWLKTARALRRCTLVLLDGLEKPHDQFQKIMKSCRAALDNFAPGSGLAVFLSTWGDAIGSGVKEQWVDHAWQRIDAIFSSLRTTRPRMKLEILKAVLMAPGADGSNPSIDLVEDRVREYWSETAG